MARIFLLWLLCFSLFPVSMRAEEMALPDNGEGKPENTGKLQRGFSRFLHSLTEIDSNYVEENHYHSTVMLNGEKHFTFYQISAKDEQGNNQMLEFSPYSTWQLGPYIGYSFIFFGYKIDIGSKRTSLNRSNLYLSIYSPLIGIDYYYEKGEDNYRLKKVSGFDSYEAKHLHNVSIPGLSTYLKSLNIYYVFNHKRFSFPAAYSQSTQQRRSAGSFILGFTYTKQKLHFDHTQLPSYLLYNSEGYPIVNDGLKVSYIEYRNYSLSSGYSYNWVFAKNMLGNLTLTPTVGYNVNRGEKLEVDLQMFSFKRLNIDFISRASVVWNTGKFYAGASAIAHTYSYKKSEFSIRNSLFSAQVYAGVNFWHKKRK